MHKLRLALERLIGWAGLCWAQRASNQGEPLLNIVPVLVRYLSETYHRGAPKRMKRHVRGVWNLDLCKVDREHDVQCVVAAADPAVSGRSKCTRAVGSKCTTLRG
jgi:hypothetical protein